MKTLQMNLDDSELVDNLSGRQLTANAEAGFNGGSQENSRDEGKNNNGLCDYSPAMSYELAKLNIGATITTIEYSFPEANYTKYRDLSPVQLFELIFDEELGSYLVNKQ